jgi:phosphoserine phosphatase
MKLAVFDFDATLMDGETINFLAQEYGVSDLVCEITYKTMRGELDFYESIKERVRHLKGMSVESVEMVCSNLPYMNGAKDTIEELKNRGYKVVVFSGGFRNATTFAMKALGFDCDFSNILHSKNGILSGEVSGDMMFNFSKGDMLQRIQKLLSIDIKEILYILLLYAYNLLIFRIIRHKNLKVWNLYSNQLLNTSI